MNQNAVGRTRVWGSSHNVPRLALLPALVAVAAVILAVLGVWWWSAPHVSDLNDAPLETRARLREQWLNGDVVVLIRHAERCDRSTAACMGPADGITSDGQRMAAAVGAGLNRLGMDNARLLVSPLTRTQQTAAAFAGLNTATGAWLHECDSDFESQALRAKTPKENLVLVTHSGCIDHFERALGVFPGERSSDYAQAFFIQADGRHKPRIIGSIGAADWARLLDDH